MSIATRFHLSADWRAAIRALIPGVSAAELDVLGVLISTDRLIADCGAEHPALINWVEGVVSRLRGGGDGQDLLPVPVPRPDGPAPVDCGALA
jgi:hypothetical protein